jgi:transcriptional regulator with XRE-family HTH domain
MTNEAKFSKFGDRLNLIIDQSGLNKKDFAAQCGIKETQLYNYLKGTSEPNTKALRNIKTNFPDVSIDWLVSGIGEPYLRGKADTPNVVDLRHEQIIKNFEDKEYAAELNQALVSLERLSKKKFYEIGGFIKRAVFDEGGARNELTGDDLSKKEGLAGNS